MTSKSVLRARAALANLFVADALAMPLHWIYTPEDILVLFPPHGVTKFEAAPAAHPKSYMILPEGDAIVGSLILKGKRDLWGVSPHSTHYHHGMPAGENTLNAYCARWLLESMAENGGSYNRDAFLARYVANMTSEAPVHPDTYAESYHRNFFANHAKGEPLDRCGVKTSGTASVGGLVTIAALAVVELLRTPDDLSRVQQLCRVHLFLTHPDEELAVVCDVFVQLIHGLLFRSDDSASDWQDARTAIVAAAKAVSNVDLLSLLAESDEHVVYKVFSPACGISGSFPVLLYLALKYAGRSKEAMLANANVGGENCHRGSVLGVICGLVDGVFQTELVGGLQQRSHIEAAIGRLVVPS